MHHAYKRAATRPTAIKRPPAFWADAAPVKGRVVLDLGGVQTPPLEDGPVGLVHVGDTVGVTVITLVQLVGTQDEIVIVETMPAGLLGDDGAIGGGTWEETGPPGWLLTGGEPGAPGPEGLPVDSGGQTVVETAWLVVTVIGLVV